MVLENGLEPKWLARSIAAAIHYEEPTDPSAVELSQMLKAQGIDYV